MFMKPNHIPHPHQRTNGLVAPFVIFGLVAVVLLGVAGYYYFSNSDESAMIDPIMTSVTRGEFVSQVLDQGEIQSSENVEIRCEVRARNGSMTVLSVVPEGTLVKPGDFLVQLDSTSFEKELEQQNLAMATAETSVIQAETGLASAIATKEQYIKGTFEEEKRKILNEIYDADSQITTAKQNLNQAIDTLAHSKKLLAKGFITQQTFESDKFAVKNAEIGLEKGNNSKLLAEKKLEVLEQITFKKEEVQLEADIKAARVKLTSENKAFAVEKEKLAEIEEMIAKCTINVPEGVSGQVVFAKESSRGGNDWVLEEGTTVRENQVLVRLPNPDKMEVKALINEQSITRIDPNMPATIKVDALNNTTLTGIVTKVNQYAESSGWGGSSVRKYAVIVKILSPPPTLKPGMNASVTIQVQYEPDVLIAPIQTVYGVQDKQYCLTRNGDSWDTIEVEIGGDNSQMVYIKDGLEEGQQLVMNPGAYKDYMDLPEVELDTKIEIPEDAKVDVGKTSGEMAQADRGPGGRPGAGEGRPGAGEGRPAGGGGGFDPAMIIDRMFEKDSDGDGKLSREEAGDRVAPMFDRGDSDGDGFLTRDELTEAFSSMGGGQRGGGGGGPRGGAK